MSSDPLLQIPEIDPNQTGKTVTMNQALVSLAQAAGATLTLTANTLTSPYTIPFTAVGDEPAVVKTALRFAWANVTGAISGDWTAYMPGGGYQKIFVATNNTTGGHNVIIKVSGQTGVTIPSGATFFCYLNGTDVQEFTVTATPGTIANDTVLANISGGTAAPSGTTLTALIDAAIGSTQGDILYRGSATWGILAPGTSGNFLQTQGASANPQWAAFTLASVADSSILSNISGGSAAPVANTLSATIDHAIGNAQGDILYRNASGWVVLAPGTSGNFLQTQGASANPQWAAAGLAAIANNDILANISGSSAAPIANTLTAVIDSAIGATQGDILYRNSSSWVVLGPGTSGQFLQTQGASANPQWNSISGSGLSPIAANTFLANATGSTASPTAVAMNAMSAVGTQTVSGSTATVTPGNFTQTNVTVNADTTLTIANGAVDGQEFKLRLLQGSGGPYTIAFDSSVVFGSDITSFSATATVGKTDYVGLLWSASASAWHLVAISRGF